MVEMSKKYLCISTLITLSIMAVCFFVPKKIAKSPTSTSIIADKLGVYDCTGFVIAAFGAGGIEVKLIEGAALSEPYSIDADEASLKEQVESIFGDDKGREGRRRNRRTWEEDALEESYGF